MTAQSKGGTARAAALDPARRSEIAKRAANARWNGAVTAVNNPDKTVTVTLRSAMKLPKVRKVVMALRKATKALEELQAAVDDLE